MKREGRDGSDEDKIGRDVVWAADSREVMFRGLEAAEIDRAHGQVGSC